MPEKFTKNKIIIFLTIIIIFGAFLRAINITWGLDKQQPYITEYEDEPYGHQSAFNIRPLEGKLNPGQWAMQKGTFYFEIVGTLNNILENLYIKSLIFPNINSESEIFFYNTIFARGVNILFAIGSIIFIYLLCITLFNKKSIGILAALNYSIFAHEIAFNNIIAADIALSFFTIATLYFSTNSYSKDKPERLWLAGLFSGFAASTKFTGIFTAVPVAVSFLLLFKKTKIKENIKNFFKVFCAFIFGFIIGMPSVLLNFNEFLNGLELQKSYQTGEFLPAVGQLPRFIYYFSNVFYYGLGQVFTILILIGIFYFAWNRRKQKESAIILSWLVIYYLVLSFSSWVTHRYTMPLMPIFAVIVAHLVFNFYNWLKNKKIALTLIIAIYFYNFAYLYNFLATITQQDARSQFYDYEKQNLKLDKQNPEITFIVGRLENTSHPTKIDYPADVLLLSVIEKEPQIKPGTKYVLVADNQIRDGLRIKDKSIVDFFENLENDYKLVKIFKKDPPLSFFFNEKTYFSSDLELFMKKYYLYEKKI